MHRGSVIACLCVALSGCSALNWSALTRSPEITAQVGKENTKAVASVKTDNKIEAAPERAQVQASEVKNSPIINAQTANVNTGISWVWLIVALATGLISGWFLRGRK